VPLDEEIEGDRMKKLMTAALASLALTFAGVGAAGAVTDGELDGEGHPYVGLMIAQDDAGNPMWRCSGTLISPTVFLTAGHCTDGADHVEIWFDADVENGMPENGYPFTGDVGGTPYTHPDYDDAAFYLADLGLVVLDEPVVMDTYGELPSEGQLDQYATKRGQNKVYFTAVGYGLQESFPSAAAWKENNERVRMVSYPKLNQINGGIVGDFSLLLSNNAHTGGTCFGDSGGPNFIMDTHVIAGVTSFGMNPTCAGTGGVFRVDQTEELAWINSFL
jgi:V8-like Glu-specific endopeptidase